MFILTKQIRQRIEDLVTGKYVPTNSTFSLPLNLLQINDPDTGSIIDQVSSASERKVEVLAGAIKQLNEINHYDGFVLYESDFTVKISYFYTHLGNDLTEVLSSESGTGYLKDINDRANNDKFNVEKTLTWNEAFGGISPEVFLVSAKDYSLSIEEDKVIASIVFNIQFQASLVEGYEQNFQPTSLSNLYAWYKFDSLLLVSSSTRVSAALDKSGNGRDAVQTSSIYQPYYSSSGGLQNKPYFRTTASLSYGTGLFAGPSGSWEFLHNGNEFTIIVVAKTGGNDWSWFVGTQKSNVNERGLSISSTITPGNLFSITQGNGSANTARIGYDGLVMDPNVYHKYIVSFSSQSFPTDSLYAKIDNKTYSVPLIRGTTAVTNSNYLGIGFGADGRYPANSNFHEVIIYDRKLTATEVNKLEMYLDKEYRI